MRIAQPLFYVVPMRLRGCKRMVAVAHSKDEIVASFSVEILHGIVVLVKGVDHLLCVYAIAFEMSAAHIQIEIVYLFKPVALCPKPFDDALFSVVDKKHNVRKLHESVFSYGKPRRNAIEHHPFRRAYERVGRMSETIVLEINRAHDSETGNSACRRAFYDNATFFKSAKHAVLYVIAHSFVYRVNTLLLVVVFEIRFGKYEFERARSVPDEIFEFAPVRALGRKLIACNHRPFSMIAILWDEYIRFSYSFHTSNLPFLRILFASFDLRRPACASRNAIAVGEMP